MDARRLALLLLAVLALAVAGCGGDDSSDAVAETDTTVIEETTSDDETTEDVETVPETTDAELGGECAELAGIGAKLSQSLSGQTGDLSEASELFDEIADQVPDEIKADYEVIAENFSKIAEALKDVDFASGETPDAEALAKLQDLTTTLNSTEVTEATANVEAWVRDNC